MGATRPKSRHPSPTSVGTETDVARGPVNAPTLWEVARNVSARLSSEGVPHALVGGLAVGAHGWDRATSDIDFLVPRSSMRRLMRLPDVVRFTELVDGVRVDYIATEPDEDFLDQAIRDAKGTPPVIPLPALVYVKLKTGWRRDQTDIVELVKHGSVNVDEVRRYLGACEAPGVAATFDELVAAADAESD